MLPMTLQFLVVMIASAINDRLQRKLDYVEEERRILQEQLDATTGGKKLSFTADQRRRLVTADKQLTPDERRKCCRLVKPETILAWFRQLAARKYDSSEARCGRPPKPKDVRRVRSATCMRSGLSKPSNTSACTISSSSASGTCARSSRNSWPTIMANGFVGHHGVLQVRGGLRGSRRGQLTTAATVRVSAA
jgi:hypothetical protein